MSGAVSDKDRGWKALLARSLTNNDRIVAVGVQGTKGAEQHKGAGISVARLAGVHEFGAIIKTSHGEIKIPERSFIRATIDAKGAYKDLIGKLAGLVLIGRMARDKALALLGEQIQSDIQRRIEKGIPPPNAASTIAKKGSSKPLIDTAQLKNSISYEVKDNDGEKSIGGNR